MSWNVGLGDAPETFEDVLREESDEDIILEENLGQEEWVEEGQEEWFEADDYGDEEWLEEFEEETEEVLVVPDLVYDEEEEREILNWPTASFSRTPSPENRHSRTRSPSPLPRISTPRSQRSRTRSRSPLPRVSTPCPGSRRSRTRSPSPLPRISQLVTVRGMFDEHGQELLPRSLLTSPAAQSPSSPVAPPHSPVPLSPASSPPPPHFEMNVEVVVEDAGMSSDEGVPELPIPARGRGAGRRGRGRGAAVRGRGQVARRGRGRGARRGRGGAAPAGEEGWRRGDRLTEVYVNDDDVQGELRETIMRANARRTQNEMRQARAGAEVADDGDVALFEGDESALRFDWNPMDSFRGEREQFRPESTGSTTPSHSAYEAFRQYWDDGILSVIATETNRYAELLAGESEAFARSWYETNFHEILILFSFWMMLGIIRMPSTKSCFTLHPLLKTNVFRKMFARLRYENLCRALHFVDNTGRTAESSLLFPIKTILDHLNSRFQSSYILKQEICIDESLTLWKGKLSFRQFIKTKAARFGVKTFELCESSTGYLWSFIVYTGRETIPDPRFPASLLVSTKTVLKLVWPLLDRGYTLYMDNWFNCPLLARFLKRHGTDCVGTLRANRRCVSPLVAHCNLQEGQFLARHSGDVVVMAYHDKKKISLISTCHGNEQGVTDAKPHVPSQWKPKLVLDYNKGMGGVDRKDQMLEPYLLERKRCNKWNMKLFKRLLNCSILNSRILLEDSTQTSKEHIVFRLELVEEIMNIHHSQVPRPMTSEGVPRVSREDLPQSRLTTNPPHWPRSSAGSGVANQKSRRYCVWCRVRRGRPSSRTTFKCETCEVALCIDPCFKDYHTVP